mmetsp:Transcript_123178/g.394528  ORF Transcript_123178/g.394528 Transcript_123178/m.394528 type:complete len:264 (-) Transcript_123178:1511-2302(-)
MCWPAWCITWCNRSRWPHWDRDRGGPAAAAADPRIWALRPSAAEPSAALEVPPWAALPRATAAVVVVAPMASATAAPSAAEEPVVAAGLAAASAMAAAAAAEEVAEGAASPRARRVPPWSGCLWPTCGRTCSTASTSWRTRRSRAPRDSCCTCCTSSCSRRSRPSRCSRRASGPTPRSRARLAQGPRPCTPCGWWPSTCWRTRRCGAAARRRHRPAPATTPAAAWFGSRARSPSSVLRSSIWSLRSLWRSARRSRRASRCSRR